MSANLQGQHNTEMALQTLGEALNRDRERRHRARAHGRRYRRERPMPTPAEPTRAKPDMAQTLEDELRIAQQALLAVELKLKPEHPDVKKQRRAVEELQKRVDAQTARRHADVAADRAAIVMDPAKRKRLIDARAELDNLDRQIQAKLAEEQPAAGHGRHVSGAHRSDADARSRARRADARLRDAAADLSRACCRRKRSRRFRPTSRSGRSASSSRFSIRRACRSGRPARIVRGCMLIAIARRAGDRLRPGGRRRVLRSSTLRTEADVRAALNLMVLATVPYMRDAAAAARRSAPQLARRRRRGIGAGRVRHRGVEAVEIAMYERYYGLQERPFDLSPNPRFLCFTPQHREALVHLAVRPGRPARRHDAGRRSRHRQDHAGSRGAAGGERRVDDRPPVESDADARGVLRIPRRGIRLQRRSGQVEDPVSARAGSAR